jgi:peptidoglycan hydrolase CwlO-like protein
MSRRVSLIILLGIVIALVLAFGVAANAEPQNSGEDKNDEEASAAQSELLQNDDELAQAQQQAVLAAEKYNQARSQVDQLNQDIAETVLKQADAEDNFNKAQASMEKQAVTVYKTGPLYLLDFLLSAESFSDFANRLWFSIKALLGMADEVQDWRNQSHELEQIATDLKAKKDTLQPAVDDAQVQKDAAQENANQLQNAIEDAKNSLPQDSGGSPAQGIEGSPAQGLGDSPTQGLGDSPAQGLGDSPTQGLGDSPAQGLGDSPAQLAPFERTVNDIHNLPAPDDAAVEPNQPVTSDAPQQFSPEIAKGLGVSQDHVPDVQDAVDKTVQSGQAANAAEKDKSNAARNLAREVANLDPQLPTGGQQGGATRGAPLSQQDSQIPKLVDDFRAAKNKANGAEQNAKKQAGDLTDTLGRALQPATGNQTTPGTQNKTGSPDNKVTTDKGGEVAAGKGEAKAGGASTKPATSAGPGGGAAVALAAKRLGAGYEMGAEGENGRYSCTGLIRAIERELGLPLTSFDPGAYYGLPHVDRQAGAVAVFPGGVGLFVDPENVILANHEQGRVVQMPASALGVTDAVDVGFLGHK